MAQRSEAVGVRPEWRGQRQVQADGGVISRGLAQRRRLGVRKGWRRHHHRGGVDAFLRDQVADRPAHRGRDAVIVGAEDDVALRLIVHSAAVRVPGAAGSAASRTFGSALHVVLHVVLGHEIDRPPFDLVEDLADIFAKHAEHDELHAAKHHDADKQRRIARHSFAIHHGLVDDLAAVKQRHGGDQQTEHGGKAQRRHRERGEAVERQADQRAHVPGAAAVGARRRLVIDAQLAKADPARQPLEEAVALRELAQRGRRPRRQQAEVAGIFRDLRARAPIEQQIKRFHRDAAAQRFIVAIGLGGVDHVVAVIEPMANQLFDQRRRMLAVAVDEHHGAEPGVVEAGQQRRFLAEIARQRHHLHVEPVGRKGARDGERVVGAAVVHIDDFAGERACPLQILRDVGEPRMQAFEAGALVVERNNDRKPGARRRHGVRLRRCDTRAGATSRAGDTASGAARVVHQLNPLPSQFIA